MSPLARMELERYNRIRKEAKKRDRQFNRTEFAWFPFVLGVVACAAAFGLWLVTHRG